MGEKGASVLQSGMVSYQQGPSSSLIPKDLATQHITTGTRPVPAAKSTPTILGSALQGEKSDYSSGKRIVFVPSQAYVFPSSYPAASDSGLPHILSLIAFAHPMPSSDGYGTDRDDDSAMLNGDEDRYLSHQASLDQSLAMSSAIAGLHDGASAVIGYSQLQPGILHAASHLLPAAAAGAAGFIKSGVAPPPPLEHMDAGLGPGNGQGGDEGEHAMPPVPRSQPLVIPPDATDSKDAPSVSAFAIPFAGLLPIDVAAIQRSVDSFFEQLGNLSEGWKDSRAIEEQILWFVAASVVAYEWGRSRSLRSSAARGSVVNYGPEPITFLAGDEG